MVAKANAKAQWGLLWPDGRQESERDEVPRFFVDATVRENLLVAVEVELTLDQAVGELSRLDGKRTDVAGELVAVFFDAVAEHDFKHTVACSTFRAEDEANEVRRNGKRDC